MRYFNSNRDCCIRSLRIFQIKSNWSRHCGPAIKTENQSKGKPFWNLREVWGAPITTTKRVNFSLGALASRRPEGARRGAPIRRTRTRPGETPALPGWHEQDAHRGL